MRLATGQVAVITGGACGIGLALARQLVGRGLYVALADVREVKVRAAAASLGEAATPFVVDVTDAQGMVGLASDVLDRFGRVDLMCNNAGFVPPVAPAWEQPVAVWDFAIDVMLRGWCTGCTPSCRISWPGGPVT